MPAPDWRDALLACPVGLASLSSHGTHDQQRREHEQDHDDDAEGDLAEGGAQGALLVHGPTISRRQSGRPESGPGRWRREAGGGR